MKVTGNTTDQTSTVKGGHVYSAQSGKKVSKTDQSGDSAKTAAPAASEADANTEISAKGREFAQAKEIASGAPDVREEKIARLKEMISSNKYKVDSHAIADRMVDEHLSSGIG